MNVSKRSSSAMIWKLGDFLSCIKPVSPLFESPDLWLEENNNHIKDSLLDISALSDSSKTLDFGRTLYPRTMAYTYGRLKISASITACTLLLDSHAKWMTMDNIAQIEHYESIRNSLREHLIRCGKITHTDRKQLLEIHRLDVLYLVARILVIPSKSGDSERLRTFCEINMQSLWNHLQTTPGYPKALPTADAIVDNMLPQVIPTGTSQVEDARIIACLEAIFLDASLILPEADTDLSRFPVSLVVPEGEQIEINAGDIVIAVMGPSGTGKSSFINQVMGHTVTEVNDGLRSCTQEVRAFGCKHPNGSGRNIILVDTPGFDDTDRTDYEVLQDIAVWLEQTYRKSIRLSGILQFHSIHESRMRGTPLRNLEMFRLLCGPNALKNVILLTTFWDRVGINVGVARELQLETQFWEPLTKHGSRVARFDPPTYECAWDLIDQLQTSAQITEIKPALEIQIDLVDKGKKLHQTSAFAYLLQFWTRIKSLLGRRQVNDESRDAKRALEQQEALEKSILTPSTGSWSSFNTEERRRWFFWRDGTRRKGA